MASAIEIANMALGYISDENIGAFTDGNKRAKAVTLFFAPSRRRALRMSSWNCCSHRASLPKDATPPTWGYNNRYLLPGDYIRLIAIENARKGVKFEIEGRYLLCDLAAPLNIKYVFDDADVTRFDPLLTTVHAHALAVDICSPLARTKAKKEEVQAMLDYWLKKALVADGTERPPQNFQETSWLTARATRG